MRTEYTYNNLRWIDVENPDRETIVSLMEQFNLNPSTAEELMIPTARPKVDVYDHYEYLVLHFPSSDTSDLDTKHELEVDFLIGKDFLITVRYGSSNGMLEFAKSFEVASTLENANIGDHAGFLFFFMMRFLYADINMQLDDMHESLKSIETRIFAGEESRMVRVISQINRRVLELRRSVQFHGRSLDSMRESSSLLFGKEFDVYMRSIRSEYNEIANTLASHKEVLEDLRSTNEMLLTTRTNHTMKVITIIIFTTMPLTLAADMATAGIFPGFSDSVGEFVAYLGIFIIIGLGIYHFFRKKDWM